jgi:tetratricopeptide (TPR) repeat protein
VKKGFCSLNEKIIKFAGSLIGGYVNNTKENKSPKKIEKYNVIFQGEIIEGKNIDNVKEKISAIFNQDPTKTERLFSGQRVIIKKNADLETCEKIRNKFADAGALCFIEEQAKTDKVSNRNVATDNDKDSMAVKEPDVEKKSNIINLSDYMPPKDDVDKEYSDIMENIASQLTGNDENDLMFLQNQADTYANHKYATEILRAVGRMIYDILPPAKKNEFDQIFSNLEVSSDAILNEAKLQIQEGELDKAEQIIKSIIPGDDFFKDDTVSAYFHFNNPFEELYYSFKFRPQKEIRGIPNFETERFLVYAYILIEQGKYDEALDILDSGLRFNPIDTKLLFEKSEIFKVRKEWDKYKKINDFCMEYSYVPSDISRAYRNYGYMYIELEDYDAAICCYLCSVEFENTQMAQSQLFYISEKLNKKIDFAKYSRKLKKIFKKRNIPLGASEDLLAFAFALAEKFENARDLEGAHFFYGILYGLTGNEGIAQKLQKLQNDLNSCAQA